MYSFVFVLNFQHKGLKGIAKIAYVFYQNITIW